MYPLILKNSQSTICTVDQDIKCKYSVSSLRMLRLILNDHCRYATAYNNIGAGEPSDILNTRTKGSKPILPDKSRFIEVSSKSITLHLPAWKDGGCRMSHFVVEHKKK